MRFLDPNHSTSLLHFGRRICEDQSYSRNHFHFHFEQTAMGIHNQRICVCANLFSLRHLHPNNNAYLQQYPLTASSITGCRLIHGALRFSFGMHACRMRVVCISCLRSISLWPFNSAGGFQWHVETSCDATEWISQRKSQLLSWQQSIAHLPERRRSRTENCWRSLPSTRRVRESEANRIQESQGT